MPLSMKAVNVLIFLATKENVTEYILTHLQELGKLDKDALIKQRQQKLMRHGI